MTTARAGTHGRSPVRLAALIVGVVFLLVGVGGFIPGLTTNFDDMTFASHDSGSELLGIFQVNILHSIVHLLFGIVGIAASRTSPGSKSFLIGGGVIYLVLWIYGLVVDHDSSANFVAIDDADNWLHLGLGVGMIALGLILPGDGVRRSGGPVAATGTGRVEEPVNR